MKIQLLSDLHLELGHHTPYDHYRPAKTDADVIVLAGDIGHFSLAAPWAEELAQAHGKPVVYVPGNHEYYGDCYNQIQQRLHTSSASNGLHLLDETCIEIQGVRFLGATLWSNFESSGEDHVETLMCQAAVYVNDFHVIKRGKNKFSTRDARYYCYRATGYLREQLMIAQADDQPTVVVTHFAPLLASLGPGTGGERLHRSYWCNDLPQLMGYASLWLHGHLHHSVDYDVNGTRCVSNPRGHCRADTRGELRYDNPHFRSDFVVEVGLHARGSGEPS